ncbi:hypothetical protein A9G45_10890 [Gilliamella sp. HK2]|uniref:hypothetical protein n=1 Tax=Gilliamella sp. HK2 TaxID=3120246 RepID=UPI00080E9F32|nr:hypothetical protein [Gilliamella apicola]OCG26591.1 hypothetical protein A9G45_10890 [Gilliamella apicola]
MALTPIKKWKYPVVVNEKQPISTNAYYTALMSASRGFYPVSINKQVHCGVHFDHPVLSKLGDTKERKVHCLATGEVIAYRVNDHYQKVDYGEKVGFFSTGFVLVRHLLEMERVEEAAEAESNTPTDNNTTQTSATTTEATQSSNATTNPATDTSTPSNEASTTETAETKKEKQPGHRLYFYSLYMHLADTQYYDDNPKEPAPAFWEQDIYRVRVGHKDLDYVAGLNIRKTADSSKRTNILAVLQAGTKVNLNLDLHEQDYKWYAVSSLVEGYCSIPELTPYDYKGNKIIGWIYNDTKKQLTDPIVEITGKDSNLVKSKGLRVRDKDKNIISMLPEGTQIKIAGTKTPKNYVELVEVIRDGSPTIPLPAGKKYVYFDCLENIIRGKKYNEVVVLDEPFPIEAGDLVGHIGHNQDKAIDKEKDKEGNYIDIDTLPPEKGMQNSHFKPTLHVECFTCEDLPNYITQTQAEASKIADEEKTLLALSKGTKILMRPSQADTTVGTPLKGSKIKVLSKETNINWLQIEIKTSATDTKTLWIENTKERAKKANANNEIELASDTEAWSKHPLQASQLTSSNHNIGTPLLLDMSDNNVKTHQHRAVDEQDTLWIYIEKALDDKNITMSPGWLSTESEGVKKVSCWDWFDFKQIKENASLKDIYLSAKKTLSRNKDNASLEQYTPTIKETLTILDKQYNSSDQKYAKIDINSFNGIINKPILASSLGRLLIHYESEWYGKLDSEGKLPKWEALNSEMTENANNILDYLTEGDEAKLDAYINTLETSKQQSEKKGFEALSRKIERFPEDYKSNPQEKLSKEQLEIYTQIQKLEQKVMAWDKTKEKIKKMLWWDDVAKGLAKLNQPKNTPPENGETANTTTTPTDSAPPATLSADGRAWFIHPVAMVGYFNEKINLIRNYTLENAELALRAIYAKYGKDMAIIIERMYRSETAHFKSLQYKKTGTGGMESFGSPPYYGWDKEFFLLNPNYTPIGTTYLFENVGLSKQGGNVQIKDRPKEFIIFPSVLAAMEYLVFYINKYNGNYARWHSTNSVVQETYKNILNKIIPRIVNKIEEENAKKN